MKTMKFYIHNNPREREEIRRISAGGEGRKGRKKQ